MRFNKRIEDARMRTGNSPFRWEKTTYPLTCSQNLAITTGSKQDRFGGVCSLAEVGTTVASYMLNKHFYFNMAKELHDKVLHRVMYAPLSWISIKITKGSLPPEWGRRTGLPIRVYKTSAHGFRP